ncbi:hypothetical protein FHW83_005897 [Duganella sp. SG902]|uniref:hypothetical protein n=1 Tax=Duganella sp. SG902 TaxID=2587016 RepID=UPI00159D3BFE|nr:hypothetical protein [Duganella sp. SG902]NVM80052.1 hypothetical protein [Duganella sp. SG902]
MPIQSGHLGGATLPLNTDTKVYQCQAPAVAATFTVNICNKTDTVALVRLGHGTGADMSAAGSLYYEHDEEVKPHGVLERTGLATSVGRSVFARSSVAGVDVSVYGYEKG